MNNYIVINPPKSNPIQLIKKEPFKMLELYKITFQQSA